jgi:predicted dehydrogenase
MSTRNTSLGLCKLFTDTTYAQNPLRIGLISVATIAPIALCIPAQQLGTVVVVAVAARNKEHAQRFAKKWNIPNVFDSYDDIINSDIVDAVYIPLPNGLHFEWAKKALEAGKHVLLEVCHFIPLS